MTDVLKFIWEITKTLIPVLPFVFLCFVGRKININQSARNRQFLMPVIALAFVIILMFHMDEASGWVIKLWNKLIFWMEYFFDWLPKDKSGIVEFITDAIYDFVKNLNIKYWIFFIMNLLAMGLYLIIKKLLIKLLDRIYKKPNRLHDIVSGTFYEYFPERDAWCIKDSFSQARDLLKVVFYTTVFVLSTLMIVTGRLYLNGFIATVFYPVVGVILIGELYYYLDGVTRCEYTKDILGEDEEAYKIVNYSLLRKYLRNIFSDKLLCENTSVNNTLAYTITNEELLDRLSNDPDPKIANFAIYYSNLSKAGFQLDHNYLDSSLDLLKGKSVIFNNPFYQDLIPYAFYPMNRALLSRKKVLVVLGRHAIEEDIERWIRDGIEAVTNIPFMWRTGVLSENNEELDIGIVTRSNVINIGVHDANADFLSNVGFVVVIEPSKLVSTAQIGLNLLIKRCLGFDDNKNIVYCMCDRNCDGLVDAMSHILMCSLTEVSATNKHLGTSSYMCWDADNEHLHHRLLPNISRYLGVGTELSYAALKNQVSKTYWYGGDAFPVTDIRWIDRQYYYDLMKYAALPTSQEAMGDFFFTSPNMWSARIEKNNYFTVEDESYNMFEVLRSFETRSIDQGFINIITSDYLLKDYMASNASIFEADAKAIPYLVADYARTRRNVVLRLILLMTISGVDETTIRREFQLIGLPELPTRKQLWFEMFRNLSAIDVIRTLPSDYNMAVKEASDRKMVSKDGKSDFTINIIKAEERYNFELGKTHTVYFVKDKRFIDIFVKAIKSSSYVAEDEKGERYFLGSELSGHIYQRYLPGQFFTFNGKYYEMQYLTSDNQVLVRRAADHIHGRPTYRQIRDYTITAVASSDQIGAVQDIDGIVLTKEYADFTVDTQGYYRMGRYNDFVTAKKVLFIGEQNGIPARNYRNKKILRIDLPDNTGKFTAEVRYTITVLLNEVFRTLFADNHPYIVALTDDSHLNENVSCRPLTYSIKGEGTELPQNSIYIIEDSEIDIGLLITVERNLKRIFEILHDYLAWNKREITRSLKPILDSSNLNKGDEDVDKDEKGTNGDDGDNGDNNDETENNGKKPNIFKRIWRKIAGFFRRIFKRKKKDDPDKEKDPKDPQDITPVEQEPTDITDGDVDKENPTEPEQAEDNPEVSEESEQAEDVPEVSEEPEQAEDVPEVSEEPEQAEDVPEVSEEPEQTEDIAKNNDVIKEAESVYDNEDSEDMGTVTGEIDAEPSANMPAVEDASTVTIQKDKKAPFDFTRTPYYNRYYLLFGESSEPEALDLNKTFDYLSDLGLDVNPLKEARNGRRIAKYVEATFKPNKKNARYCDFCGNEIYGIEYETLADGRDRCISCGRTAVKTEAEFQRIFEDVKRNMEAFFGIKINTGIRVEMVNSQRLHKRLKKAFVPTPDADGRVLGVAIKDKNGYTLMIENGSPRINAMLTIAHELTHIWQYLNWDDKHIKKTYGKALRLEIYEGMAKWVEIQYAYLINEPSVAKREEICTVYREDEYGNGYIRYRANYPLTTGTVITKDTPFTNIEMPLDKMYCGSVSLMIDPNNGARGYDDEDDDFLGDLPDDSDESAPTREKPKPKETYSRDQDNVSLYAYGLLSDREKELYNIFCEAIYSQKTRIDDIPDWVTQEDVVKIRSYVLRDHPEIFWYNGSVSFTYETDTGRVTSCQMTYCLTSEDVLRRNEQIEVAVADFLSGISPAMSDYEVAIAVYNNIIDLVDYDSLKLARTGDKVSDDVPDDLRSIYGVFVEKKAVCAGYAKAIQFLLNRLGIECTYVTGDGNEGPHAWNLIRLGGEYYHLDVTWDDHSNTEASKNDSYEITYDYFCVTTEDILRDHTPDNVLPLPECTSRECNYYYRNGLLLENFDFVTVRDIVKDKVLSGEYKISLKAANQKTYDNMSANLIKGKKIEEIIRYLNLDSLTRVSASYAYSYSDEKLKIYISLNKI